MCGILQVLSRHHPVPRPRFEEALSLMKHRGPDHTGIRYHDESVLTRDGGRVSAASGHQRLSILDLCERSHQPFRRDGRCLVFNGEIYNFRELRTQLETEGGRFTTSGDTEVLFEGLRIHGANFLTRCNGMWAFACLDENNGTILAGRDRHGKKPLFFLADDSRIILSSTILPLFRFNGSRPRFRDELADAYLAHGVMFPPGDDSTHFHELRQVPPGHTMEADLSTWTIRLQRYFSIAESAQGPPPAESELVPLLRDAVISRLVSDRKVGLLLSGGIDSTLVLSVIHSQGLQDQVRCYIGETGRSEDAAFAKRCVEQLGIEASVIDLGYGDDALGRHLRMCTHQEKPFPFLGSSMAMSEMYERIAADDVRVVLDGTGGDEFFGGYWDRQYPTALREALLTGNLRWISSSLPAAPKPLTRAGRMTTDLFRRATGNPLDLRTWRRKWSGPGRTLGFHKSSPAQADPMALPSRDFAAALTRDASPGGRLGEWIWHNDRNAMMSGIENRSPILDYRLVPFLATGYASKFVGEWNKHQLRKAFDSFTPLPTQWRREKQGFRWNGRAFLRANQKGILELISSSPYLASRYRSAAYADRCRTNGRFLVNPLTPRLLCIAGIEQALGVGA